MTAYASSAGNLRIVPPPPVGPMGWIAELKVAISEASAP